MTGRWGPEGRQAAVSITFDNLGEASDLEFGRWPTDRPVGGHHSALRDLPLVLEALGDAKATFFVEAWNLPVYPAAIRSIVEAGHDIGSHGIRHEIWARLTPDQERDHLARCLDDFARYGIEIRGLRPPGGIAAGSSVDVLPEFGLSYISPIEVPTGVLENGLAVLTCALDTADVAFYAPAFAKYRKHNPSDTTVSPEELIEGMTAAIENTVTTGGYVAMTWHPFYQSPTPEHTDPARIEAIAEVVRRIRSDERVWCASPAEVADWMTMRKSEFARLDNLDPPDYWNPSFYKDIKR
jgi:peptidoglycan/xylan/chitin deacetylase (PgdA/CDA1 family)